MTVEQYENYIDSLPKASHDMEHISNFGRIVAKGFVLLASEIHRSEQRLGRTIASALGGNPITQEVRSEKQEAERKAKRARLEAALAELGGDEPEAA